VIFGIFNMCTCVKADMVFIGLLMCAQHGRHLAGASPAGGW
jgi:hypothetical protein